MNKKQISTILLLITDEEVDISCLNSYRRHYDCFERV